jgi:hypothetical protein
MVYQSVWNSYVAYKIQSALNSQSSGGSAKILRTTGGTGGKLTKASYGSNEQRRDGMRTRGRHGAKRTTGTYPTELILGEADDTLEAVMRGTYSAADLAITEATASLTSITTTTNTIVASAGSWLTAGVRANEVWRLTNHATSANNNIDLPVTGVTASTITVAGTPLTLNATPDTAFTLTRPGRKLINPVAGSLISRYWTIEEYEYDIDSSELFTDAVWTMFKYGLTKDNLITVERKWTGTGAFETKTAGSAPFFTSPSATTAAPMAVVDAAIYYNGVAVADLVSFDLTIDLKPVDPPTVGVIAPDVPTGTMGVSMNLGLLRGDLLKVADFTAETPLSIMLVAVENESEPKDFHLINVPNFTLGDVAKGAASKAGGLKTQTLTIPEDLVGIDNTGGAFDSTMVKFQISNAS